MMDQIMQVVVDQTRQSHDPAITSASSPIPLIDCNAIKKRCEFGQ